MTRVFRAVLWNDYESEPVAERYFNNRPLAEKQAEVWKDIDDYDEEGFRTEIYRCEISTEVDTSEVY